MQQISPTQMVIESAANAERQMMQKIVANTGLEIEMVASLLISDGDLVALFDTVLSTLFLQADFSVGEVGGNGGICSEAAAEDKCSRSLPSTEGVPEAKADALQIV